MGQVQTVFTSDYLKRYKPIHQTFTNRILALKQAKELRKLGYTITVKKWDLSDIAEIVWEVSGHIER